MGSDGYVYDLAGRLIKGTADQQRSGGANQQEYSYDAFGNRLSRTTTGAGCVGGCAGTVAFTVEPTSNHIADHGATYDEAGMGGGQIGAPGSSGWRYVYTGGAYDPRRCSAQNDSGI